MKIEKKNLKASEKKILSLRARKELLAKTKAETRKSQFSPEDKERLEKCLFNAHVNAPGKVIFNLDTAKSVN
jgi:hypothetical protein